MPDPTPAPTRRGFLAAGGVAVAAAAGADEPADRTAAPPPKVELPDLFAPTERTAAGPPNPLPPERRVGFAVVGLGHLSLEEILPAFGKAKLSRVTALVTGDKAKGLAVARQYGVPEKSVLSYKEYDALKDLPGVDVVYVVLPNSMHCEYTVRAAAAGKHVLCEKPMANSSKECEEMIAACAKAGRKLMIAYRLQYEPHHRAVIGMIRGGEFGAVKFITADNGQNQAKNDQWRHKKALAGGGSLPDVGIYCLSAARYLTGEEPVELSATVYSTPNDPRFKEVEENVAFRLRFPSGAIANCTTGYGHHESRRCRVVGETGWADLDPAFSYQGLRLRTAKAEGKAEAVTERKFTEGDQFAREMDHMAACVRADRRPHTPGEEGLQDMRLIEALYAAAGSGRAVTLPEVPGKDTTRGPAPGA